MIDKIDQWCCATAECVHAPVPDQSAARPATADQHRPRRGSDVEAWIKAARDRHDRDDGCWWLLDELLDDYRLHADTGTPLTEYACEGRCQECQAAAHRTAAEAYAPAERANVPRADWSSSWAELTGYVQQAAADGIQLDPVRMGEYLVELKRRALAPVRDWMNVALAAGAPRPPSTEEN